MQLFFIPKPNTTQKERQLQNGKTIEILELSLCPGSRKWRECLSAGYLNVLIPS